MRLDFHMWSVFSSFKYFVQIFLDHLFLVKVSLEQNASTKPFGSFILWNIIQRPQLYTCLSHVLDMICVFSSEFLECLNSYRQTESNSNFREVLPFSIEKSYRNCSYILYFYLSLSVSMKQIVWLYITSELHQVTMEKASSICFGAVIDENAQNITTEKNRENYI